MIEQRASVHWEGAGKTGRGSISTGSGALQDYPYGFTSRFEGDRKGTNPEEIVGAAHAACFTMAFAFACEKAGIVPGSIDTTAKVRLAKQGDGFLDRSHRADAGRQRAGHRRGEVPATGPGRQAELPAVQGAGGRARDHAGSETARLKARRPALQGELPYQTLRDFTRTARTAMQPRAPADQLRSAGKRRDQPSGAGDARRHGSRLR